LDITAQRQLNLSNQNGVAEECAPKGRWYRTHLYRSSICCDIDIDIDIDFTSGHTTAIELLLGKYF
jgi:hypothetical protein